jgi:catalase
MSEDGTRTTTDAGRPVGDNQNSLTVGPRGPVVFERHAKADADIPALLDRGRSPRSGRTKTTRWSTSGSSCWTAIP